MRQRGDTIIEVVLAVTVFSLIAVGALSVMNQGTAIAQQSLEISLVRDQMDSQADALRYAHNAYIVNLDQSDAPAITVWNKIIESPVNTAQDFTSINNARQCNLPSSGEYFALDIKKLDGTSGSPIITTINSTPTTFAQLHYGPSSVVSDGLWTQVVHTSSSGTIPGYYDFHIRACWLAPGQSIPVTLATIVRLYDPAP